MYQYIVDLLGVSNMGVLGNVLAAFVLVFLLSLIYELLYQVLKWVAAK